MIFLNFKKIKVHRENLHQMTIDDKLILAGKKSQKQDLWAMETVKLGDEHLRQL